MFARLDVSSKVDLDNLSQDVEVLWNEWQLRVLMLLSLFLQIVLTVCGNQRKYTVRVWLGALLWLAYLSADWVATFSLGILARSEADSTDPNLIPLFWAPILLVHLGGPETITAYSIDQVNKLWLNRLLELVTHVGVASYVMFKLWKKNSMTLVAIPIFISGIIKYAERIWAFKLARSEAFRSQENNLVVPQASAKTPCISIEDIVSCDNVSKDEVRYLHEARVLFKTFHNLFKDFDIVNLDKKITYDLVCRKDARYAFRLTGVELGFMYDHLYSKVTEISWPRVILHSITFLCSTSALVFFSIMTMRKNVYSKYNAAISYLLLVGAVLLESYSIIVLLLSDWTMLWLSSNKKAGDILSRINCFCPVLSFFHKRRRWSRSMAQHNLISAQSNKPMNKLLEKFFPGKWCPHSWEDVDDLLEKLIFNQVMGKSMRILPGIDGSNKLKKLLEERGDHVLGKDECFKKIRWSVTDVDFTHSLLTWHIATHVCYCKDQGYDVADQPNRKMSKSLSSYMLYLLIDCPNMLPGELKEARYTDTRTHLLRNLLQHKKPKDNTQSDNESLSRGFQLCKILQHRKRKDNTRSDIESRAEGFQEAGLDALDNESLAKGLQEADLDEFFRELLLHPPTMLEKIKLQDEGEMSALLDGCMLAMSLHSLEIKNNLSKEKKWEMISEVWVEMLMHAASHCGWKEHAHALARGGELLTHVCVLMAHLGLCKQCRPEVSEQLEARYERLGDIVSSDDWIIDLSEDSLVVEEN